MVTDLKCVNCGGTLQPAPGASTVKCVYCNSEFSLDQPYHTANVSYEQEALRELRAGRYIDAIKVVRERSGRGLKEAKEYVDQLATRYRIEVPRTPAASMLVIIAVVVALLVVGMTAIIMYLQ